MNYGFSWLIELHSGGLSSDCCRSTLDENTNLFASVFVAVHMSKILISFKNCICICSSRILSCHWLVIVMIDCRGIFLVVYSTRRRSKLWSAVLGFNGTTNHHYQLCHILKNQYSYKFTFKSSLSVDNEKKSRSLRSDLTRVHFVGEIDELVFCQFCVFHFSLRKHENKARCGKTAIVTNRRSVGFRVKNETRDMWTSRRRYLTRSWFLIKKRKNGSTQLHIVDKTYKKHFHFLLCFLQLSQKSPASTDTKQTFE